jgi:hypothetical protein
VTTRGVDEVGEHADESGACAPRRPLRCACRGEPGESITVRMVSLTLREIALQFAATVLQHT